MHQTAFSIRHIDTNVVDNLIKNSMAESPIIYPQAVAVSSGMIVIFGIIILNKYKMVFKCLTTHLFNRKLVMPVIQEVTF